MGPEAQRWHVDREVCRSVRIVVHSGLIMEPIRSHVQD